MLNHRIIQAAVLFIMLIGMPLLGVLIAGLPLARYLEFPPTTRYLSHAPFSWTVFCGYAVFILIFVGPPILHAIRKNIPTWARPVSTHSFPWWGWVGMAAGAWAWVLAWSRFAWFEALQPHTFVPLWLAYIVVVNALASRRTGGCMLLDQPSLFIGLFPVSAVFWWFFEYLNRFVQNWYYSGSEYGPGMYFILATLSFSTVLPAVSGTYQLFISSNRLRQIFGKTIPVNCPAPKSTAWGILICSGLGLAGIGMAPNHLFPLLWIAPLLTIVSVQVLFHQDHVLATVGSGNWHPVISAALAALVCGFFWEMWNIRSLAKWIYTVPYVNRFHIFEMPLLGYAGYLPFGLECMAIVKIIEKEILLRPKPPP